MSNRKAVSNSKKLPLALCQRLRRLFLAAVDLYAALLVFYFLLRIVFGDRLWPVALFSTFLHHLLLPAFIFLPVMLRVRRWPTAVMLAVGVAAFLWLFGGLFFPQLSAPAHTGILTVMTYNVANDSIAPGDLVSVLRASGADIIALQELSGEHATAIERDLGDLYPHQALHGYGILGNGLLSRYPILEEELFYLEAHRLPTRHIAEEPYEIRIAIDTDNGVHFGHGIGDLAAVSLRHAPQHDKPRSFLSGVAEFENRAHRLPTRLLDECTRVDQDEIGLVR